MQLFTKASFQYAVLLILCIVALMHWYTLQSIGMPRSMVTTEVMVSFAGLYLLLYFQSALLNFYAPTRERQWIILAWAAIFALAWYGIQYAAAEIYFKDIVFYFQLLKATMYIRIIIAWLVIAGIGFYNLLWRSQDIESLAQEKQQATEELFKEAELFKLRAQMQPHFLFNSLNSINALVVKEPQQARRMIQQLSEYMRATLKKEEKELTTLQEEMNYLNLYLEIEKVRFGHRLKTLELIEEPLMQLKLPVLILQPIVENAIKYGLYNTINDVVINITAAQSNNVLQISITNPYNKDSNSYAGTGFGLNAINKRLQLIFGQYEAVKINRTEQEFTTTLFIPQNQ